MSRQLAVNYQKIMSSTLAVTYSALKSLRDNSKLNPGQHYRITDYVTTTTQDNTQSAGHAFDVIVRADSENVLNENAYAALHSGDTYFEDCDLAGWRLKYSIDNDTDKYLWADSTNGKGVIYEMEDEFANICPYDFKNIMFERFKVTAVDDGIWTGFVGQYYGLYCPIEDGYYPDGFTLDTSDSVWRYTFNYMNSSNPADLSKELSFNCSSNKILIADKDGAICLNNIVFLNEQAGSYCQYNSFGNSCYSNSFGNYCYYNSFGNNCNYNSFGNSCYSNSFGETCVGNTLEERCQGNHLDDNVKGCKIDLMSNYNTIDIDCEGIVLRNAQHLSFYNIDDDTSEGLYGVAPKLGFRPFYQNNSSAQDRGFIYTATNKTANSKYYVYAKSTAVNFSDFDITINISYTFSGGSISTAITGTKTVLIPANSSKTFNIEEEVSTSAIATSKWSFRGTATYDAGGFRFTYTTPNTTKS